MHIQLLISGFRDLLAGHLLPNAETVIQSSLSLIRPDRRRDGFVFLFRLMFTRAGIEDLLVS